MITMGNLLMRAMRVCGNETIQWYSFVSSVETSIGTVVSTFADPVPVVASVQPMQRTLMAFLGLDANREYVVIYTSNPIADLARDIPGDQIMYNNEMYQVMNNTEWNSINGWQGTVAVKLTTP